MAWGQRRATGDAGRAACGTHSPISPWLCLCPVLTVQQRNPEQTSHPARCSWHCLLFLGIPPSASMLGWGLKIDLLTFSLGSIFQPDSGSLFF